MGNHNALHKLCFEFVKNNKEAVRRFVNDEMSKTEKNFFITVIKEKVPYSKKTRNCIQPSLRKKLQEVEFSELLETL